MASWKAQDASVARSVVTYLALERKAVKDRWVPYFKRAVEVWQEAFEQAGFKNAIQARLAPTPEENPLLSL